MRSSIEINYLKIKNHDKLYTQTYASRSRRGQKTDYHYWIPVSIARTTHIKPSCTGRRRSHYPLEVLEDIAEVHGEKVSPT